jgi:hypothetical protein
MVTGIDAHIPGSARRDAGNSLLPVIVPLSVAPNEKIAEHGMVNVAALVMTAGNEGCGYVELSYRRQDGNGTKQ